MKTFFTITISLFFLQLNAQTTADFESFNLSVDEFLNGNDDSGGFSDGNIFLPNSYDANWDSWSGWAISATTDVSTEGFTNQYSVISGAGAEQSLTYATSFVLGESIISLKDQASGGVVNGLRVNNATYTYLSMANGDAFAKKFGGETGDDPDFLKLTIRKYLNGFLGQDSIEFYLADFRFDDNNLDYLVGAWTYVDLTPLGNVDSLSFTMSSSDVGAFGMNTPAYFCIDNLETSDQLDTSTEEIQNSILVYPNPVSQFLNIETEASSEKEIFIFNNVGQLVKKVTTYDALISLDLIGLEDGIYHGQIISSDERTNFQFHKNK